ncbi:hypothetical protein [Pectobacterium carotovorum]|uniref:Uncharacterized protein n=1 Tax=Pectobacterium carotovorum TaxID=554 RepID=A0A419AZB6_PECCA|nr:hypothetical protein [Pectobacterium carotovorum]RJL53709.1 hypothetical protein D5071_03750 [Pectobacterium carotovorum]
MPSKGVDFGVYINGVNFNIVASKYDAGSENPSFNKIFSALDSFQFNQFEINTDLPFHVTGTFDWTVNSAPPFHRKIEVNGLTGNMSGDFEDMMKTPSIINETSAISYGFYDAGSGSGGLTNRDQNYVYITPNMSNWMGDAAEKNPNLKSSPFYNFAFPGSHDAGSFDLKALEKILNNSALLTAFLGFLAPILGVAVPILVALGLPKLRRLLIKLAVTQKDDISTQLNLGCRYFDFRPGKLPSPFNTVAPDFYHIHSIIPGYSLSAFLTDVFGWLEKNPTEIVVVSLNGQGLSDSIIEPTKEELESIVSAINNRFTSIKIGNSSDLNASYDNLISEGKRLIFLNQLADWNLAPKYDSYSDADYSTLNPENIINALKRINPAPPAGKVYTVLQLQDTATNAISIPAYISEFLSLSDASSVLMSTKLSFDKTTYPWVLNNAAQIAPRNLPVIFLNDFVDNNLALISSNVTLQRIEQRTGYFTIESLNFKNVFLRIDGSGSNQQNPAGFGTVNAQYGPPGEYEKFSIETDENNVSRIRSLAFPNAYLRLDGNNIDRQNPAGAGIVNCQYTPPGPWEKFYIEENSEGNFTIRSVQFPDVYLRLDGSNIDKQNPAGAGVVNGQYAPPGPWEVFKITKLSGNQ